MTVPRQNDERRLSAILAADMVGYTRRMEDDTDGTVSAWRAARENIIDPAIATHSGRIVKHTGDGFLAEFPTVLDAVQCAIQMQRELTVSPLDFRMGINLGDIIDDGEDIYGEGVNLAARIEALADPGTIFVSSGVFDLVRNRLEHNFQDMGEHRVKNVARPVRVYQILPEGQEAKPPRRRALAPRTVAAAATGLLVFVLGGVAWLWSIQPAPQPDAPDKLATAAMPVSDKPSIAVLPFANMSGDPEQEYFADGMTEDILTGLAKFGFFFVISRNSTFTYKGVSTNVRDVARDLGVKYVLEGSVRKAEGRVRITAQLIDAVADKHIWAENYDSEVKDIFLLQDEITRKIVAAVAPEYVSAEMQRAQRKDERNLDAWDAFMRSYWHTLRFTEDHNATAQRLLGKAIELDPNRARYHGLLAVTHTMDAFYGWSGSRDESFRIALAAAERGIGLDDKDTQSIRSAGLVHFFSNNHDQALSYYERAVAANPNEAENRALLGAALGVAGDYGGAVEQFETALRLSPRDVHIATWYNYLAVAAFIVRRDEDAVTWAKKTVQSNPTFPGGPRTLAASYANLGQLAEAEAAREKLQELLPHLTIGQLRESLPYFKDPKDLERYLDGLRKAGLPE